MAKMGQCAGAHNKKPVWAGDSIRLDPYALPQKVSYDRAALSTRGQAVNDRNVEVVLDATGAVMKRVLDCGLPLSLALPNRAFQGVAARAFENRDGTSTVTLELLHKDADLSVPLSVSCTIEEAACDWHSWARRLGLPMLLVDENGAITVVKDHKNLELRMPKPRRRRSSMLRHRPNFLRRRKTGMIGPVVRIKAEEIIARN